MDSLTEMGGNGPLQSGRWGSDADWGGPTPSSAPLHLFTSSNDIGALVLRP